MFKKIIVAPREECLEMVAAEPNKELVCVVSISTPFNQQLDFSEHINDYLFTDEETREFDFMSQVFHMEFDDIDHNPHGYYMPMHFRQAASTWIFVRHWHEEYLQEKEKILYVHCDAGISRSAGVASAIALHFDIPVETIRHPHPNKHVMRMMKQGLCYLEEGLSPKQQHDADQKAMEELFGDDNEPEEYGVEPARRLSEVKEQAKMSTDEAVNLLLGYTPYDPHSTKENRWEGVIF